jgi:hypothetical protein
LSEEETPGWRFLVVGLLCVGMAGYMLVNGEIAIDKQRSMIVTRGGDPLLYWALVAVPGALGVLALRKVWKWITA